MAVNKKKREKEKGKRKRKDSPWVVGMSVQFEHCSKCSNIAKQGQIVQIVFEQHTTAWQTVQTLFEHMERDVNMSKHCLKCLNSTPPHGGLVGCSDTVQMHGNRCVTSCLNTVWTARKAVRDV